MPTVSNRPDGTNRDDHGAIGFGVSTRYMTGPKPPMRRMPLDGKATVPRRNGDPFGHPDAVPPRVTRHRGGAASVERVEGRRTTAREILLNSQLVVRGSTGPARRPAGLDDDPRTLRHG